MYRPFLIRYIKVENGETIAFVKNSHGLKSGDNVVFTSFQSMLKTSSFSIDVKNQFFFNQRRGLYLQVYTTKTSDGSPISFLTLTCLLYWISSPKHKHKSKYVSTFQK
ncbi:unnamed protein product [Arabidopsis halleri]